MCLDPHRIRHSRNNGCTCRSFVGGQRTASANHSQRVLQQRSVRYQLPIRISTMSPRISIAVATLNRAQLLDRAIKSALAQRYDDIEIIASDNGSIDNTK